ncbi:uncharacterized protein LOC110038446 [Phalaenopsis equestris]|uniref:uncharacterized protein LOC110038446 n=1 Tax=Phalaenopsis equestris TaxID=78828 RepID=UPI0009E2470F|nr:uncharacterized protein LOC110038446 [Phalaenopsis equestris]
MTAMKLEGIATRRFRLLRQLGKLLRCIEAAAALILLSHASIQIPAAARNSGEFIRHTAAFLTSPSFVFLLCNAIVLVLLKTGHFSSESGSTGTGIGKICGEMSYSPPLIFGSAAAEKKTACVQNRAYRRGWSEKFERGREEAKLRRAESECFRKGEKAWSAVAREREVVGADDRVGAEEEHLDAEEFRRTIEDFIAKQQRFLRLESQSLAVVAKSEGVGHRLHEF